MIHLNTEKSVLHSTIESKHPNELTFIERILLCPGEPFRSAWLQYSLKSKPDTPLIAVNDVIKVSKEKALKK